MAAGNFFGGAFFGGGFFGPISNIPIPTTPRLQGGSPGIGIDPRYSSLTKTRNLPGMRDIIEADDERIVQAVSDLFTKGTLH